MKRGEVLVRILSSFFLKYPANAKTVIQVHSLIAVLVSSEAWNRSSVRYEDLK